MKEKEVSATETTHNGRTSRNQGQNARELTRGWLVCIIYKNEKKSIAQRAAKWSKRENGKNNLGFDSEKVIKDQGKDSKDFQKQKPYLEGLNKEQCFSKFI